MRTSGLYVFASVSALALMTPAFAQDAPAADEADTADVANEIVVVGTSLRKVAPAGVQTLGVSEEDVKATSAISTQALLASIPQMGSFNGSPYAGIGGARLTVNRINLRGLPIGTGGGSPTLTLIDGHRFVGSGIQQAAPDPSIIPPGMIERVEVLLGGGSAVYGADAIGGVLNFITKKDVDGFEISARHGFGNEYHSNTVDFLAGKTWSTGSVYVGYSYAQNSAIRNADRDFVRSGVYTNGFYEPNDVACDAGNVQTTTSNGRTVLATYAITGPTSFSLGKANICDRFQYAEQFPREIRHAVMGGFRQELGDSVEISVKGYYSTRTDILNSTAAGNLGFTVDKRFGEPGYVAVAPGDTNRQKVSGTFVDWAGPYNPTETKLVSWGITPSLTWKIGGDWQMRAFYNVGESRTTVHEPSVNTSSSTGLQRDATSGAFNPYNPGAASNAAAVANALNWESYGIGISHIDNAKLVFDGPLINLPGGEVRIAVGGEYLKETYRGISGETPNTPQHNANGALNPFNRYSRNMKSGFAEASIPVFGPDNSTPGIESFTISAAVRFDSYSDFGNNWSPALGASWKPVNWLTVRANWNKSFQAPSPSDLAYSNPTSSFRSAAILQQVSLLQNPTSLLGTLAGGGNPGATTANGILFITGTDPFLQPQKSTNFTIGFDMSPPVIPGLTVNMSYFNIKYYGIISMAPHGSQPTFWADFPGQYAMNPTYQQVIDTLAASGVPAASQAVALSDANCTPASCPLYSLSVDLKKNLGNAKVSGLDLGFNYRMETGFGAITASFNGTYLLNFQQSPSDGAPFSVNGVGNQSSGSTVQRFNFSTSLGANMGDHFRAQLTFKHTGGYDLLTTQGLGQTRVDAFNVFDLYTAYDIDRDGLPPITLSLGITNLFDQDPPNLNGGGGNSAGYAGSTLGRVATLGAQVKF